MSHGGTELPKEMTEAIYLSDKVKSDRGGIKFPVADTVQETTENTAIADAWQSGMYERQYCLDKAIEFARVGYIEPSRMQVIETAKLFHKYITTGLPSSGEQAEG